MGPHDGLKARVGPRPHSPPLAAATSSLCSNAWEERFCDNAQKAPLS